MNLTNTEILSCDAVDPPFLMIGCENGITTIIEPDLKSLIEELSHVEKWLGETTVINNFFKQQKQARQQQLLGYINAIQN